MFSIIILVAIVTSLTAPLMLKFTVKRVKLTQEETKRLQKETLTEGSLVAKIHRVLLPVRRRDEKGISKNQMLQAFILKRIEKKTELSVTLYNVSSTKTKKQSKQFLTDLSKFFTQKEVVPKIKISPTPFKTILEELQKDYDLLVLGASESKDELVFNSLINFLVRKSPCLTMIVKGTEIDESWSPKRILVPTNGTTAARQAAEFAFFISSAAKNEEVILLNIANIEQNDGERIKISNQIVHELSHLGEAFDAKATEKVVVSYQTEQSIISVSENENVDLIILGTHLRAGSAELFLGMKVEFILKNAKCPVIVVNSA
ncbi:universal stress protein [bacterium]|nr:universal stress protein [bacterium]